MGRHSDGKNNYALSKELTIGLIAVILVILAVVAWWLWPGEDSSDDVSSDANGQAEETECIQGDLLLPIAADATELATELMTDWAETNPVVRDYCVQPELVDNAVDAAVYIGSTSGYEDATRTAASSEETTVGDAAVGVASVGEFNLEDIDPADVAYPVADRPDVAAIVAQELHDDDAAAVQSLAQHQDTTYQEASSDILWATSEDDVPEEATFEPVAHVAVTAVALTPAGDISEEQSRAAAAFVEWAGQQYSGDKSALATADTELLAQAAELPATAPADTLFLVDTSVSTEGVFDQMGRAVADAAATIIDDGNAVAVWNYSSPLNPGVTQGWRTNLSFGATADEVGRVLAQLGTGGVPQTRSATLAAVAAASEHAGAVGESAQVIVVTTGTDNDLSDEAFQNQAGDLPDDIELIVIHVGEQPVDQQLAEFATESVQVGSAEELAAQLERFAE